jgi:hypothetical protein
VKILALSLLILAVAAGPAAGAVQRVAPTADASLPFRCDWGYDWDERCYRDFSDRLAVGGDVDKAWRSALRFPLEGIPHGAVIDSAMLSLSFDGVCLGPRKTDLPCPARVYTIDVHPILSHDWFREREVDIGPLADQASLWTAAPRVVSWDVTDLVTDWVERGLPNNGLLLKLADVEEGFLVSGPRLPSSEFAEVGSRPVLEVAYRVPG